MSKPATLTPALRQTLLDYLAGHNTLTLATCGPAGPAAAALFYVHDAQLRLYFLSEAKAQHVAHLADDGRVAVAIHEDYQDWRAIQGVQMRGKARPAGGPLETLRIMGLYLAKYPFLQEFLSDPRRAGEVLTEKLGQSRFYIIEPTWARWIDNRASFGFRREFDLRESEDTHER
jgi:uncharacterized protein YhbP (UPF0306 family)